MLSRWQWFTAYDRRKAEWLTALHTTGFGLFLGLPMQSMTHTPGLRAAASIIPEWGWAWLFGGVGIALIQALHLTTTAWWATFLRAGLMLAAMGLYLGFGTPFARVAPYSPATFTYFSFALLFCGGGFIASCREVGQVIAEWRGDGR